VKVPVGDRELTISASVGAATIELEDDAKAWFDRADRGLYAAKSAGRNRVAVGRASDP
jgi:PleD family two-component response regulator